MSGKAEWEEITRTKERGEITDRLKAPGGWIYRTTVAGVTGGIGVSTVFVADMEEVLRRSTQASVDMVWTLNAEIEAAAQ